MLWRISIVLMTLIGAVTIALVGCEPTQSIQRGTRGSSMLQVYKPTALKAAVERNYIPEPEPQDDPDPEAPAIKDVFQNVQVLNDLTVLEFSRLMQAMANWLAPEQGCEFCHNPEKLESDEKYTKVVARRMLQMTRRINTEWKEHVVGTGVTCWTCHRGQAVPSGDWFAASDLTGENFIGRRAARNSAGNATVGYSALPEDPLSTYLTTGTEVRIQGTQAFAPEKHDSIIQARSTYALMMYISGALGVNCTYCHSTRAMGRWAESTPQRSRAWYGIRMVRDLNTSVLMPLKDILPANRLGPDGDPPKVACATCHKGTYKPLFGVSMLKDYPELAGPMVRADQSATAPAPKQVVAKGTVSKR
jgi:photosynthetic reaction center cytochrome c subunit